MTKVREVFGPDEIRSPFSVRVHEHPRQESFRPTLSRNIAFLGGVGPRAGRDGATRRRVQGKERAPGDAAERLGRCPSRPWLRGSCEVAMVSAERTERPHLRATPIRPANTIRSVAELGLHADSSLGRQAGWMVRRFDGEDAALTGETAAHAHAWQGSPLALRERAGRPKRARPASEGHGPMGRSAAPTDREVRNGRN